jgi:hypothetical protein
VRLANQALSAKQEAPAKRRPRAVKRLKKRVVLKADGRYLIYFEKP